LPGFLGKARLTEMYLIVNHAGHQVRAVCIDNLIAGLGRNALTYFGNKAIFNTYIGLSGLPLVDEPGVQNAVVSHGW